MGPDQVSGGVSVHFRHTEPVAKLNILNKFLIIR